MSPILVIVNPEPTMMEAQNNVRIAMNNGFFKIIFNFAKVRLVMLDQQMIA